MATALNFRQSSAAVLFSRFFYSYVVLYCLSNQFVTSSILGKVWTAIVPPFANFALGIDDSVAPANFGSGDGIFSVVSLLVYAIVALGLASLWTFFSSRNNDLDRKLQTAIWILVRYYIIWQMLLYGFAKVMYMQFQPPSNMRLLQPLGEFSPMGLLWTFMGYSEGYTVFTGIGEVVGGLLLLFRRTTTVGALVVFGVMVNVMMLNFCYDVPVKLLSTHLVLLSLFLLYLDRERIWAFVNNRVVVPVVYIPLFHRRSIERIKRGLKWLIVIIAVGGTLFRTNIRNMVLSSQAETDFPGYYEVQSFERNGRELAPLLTDGSRWHYLEIGRNQYAQIMMTDGRKDYFNFSLDSTKQEMSFQNSALSWESYTLQFQQNERELILEGTNGQSDSLYIVLEQRRREDFPLVSQGFRWVQERPHNR